MLTKLYNLLYAVKFKRMTKDSKFVKAWYLGKELPPKGTMTEYGKIYAYNANGSIDVGGIVLHTITGNCCQDTLEINNVKLLDCKANLYWII
jgi:hypothetical protein